MSKAKQTVPPQIGWAQQGVTPERPVVLRGQFHARISQSVLNEFFATPQTPGGAA